ncbi:MAG: 3-phosphoshikimate 1-carboxyvinyltransferase [Actinobacteria bacterium]|nr:3-phosphoshikimate 1-carboxyvinyltransferase [Actinomycetota bacterium]
MIEIKKDRLIIKPVSKVEGFYEPPPDKSISHRAVILSAISKGKSIVENFLISRDTMATVECLKAVGVEVSIDNASNRATIISKGARNFSEPECILDAKNSATTMRLLTGLFSSLPHLFVFTGDKYLVRRPMKRIIEPLTLMGSFIMSRSGGYPPLCIKGGKLRAIEYKMEIPSAQVKSSIILAGIFAEGKTVIYENGNSRDHTENMLKEIGSQIRVEDGLIEVSGDANIKGDFRFEVPGDPSSAAFMVAASVIAKSGELAIVNVNLNPRRTGFVEALKRAGADIQVNKKGMKCGEPFGDILVRSGRNLKGFKILKEEVPTLIDEIPVLAVVAAFAEGESYFEGLSELRVKETDRLNAVAENLRKMKVKVEVKNDDLLIEGKGFVEGSTLDSFGDHRIAMAFTIASLFAHGQSVLLNPDCIDVSYPSFFDDIRKIVSQ